MGHHVGDAKLSAGLDADLQRHDSPHRAISIPKISSASASCRNRPVCRRKTALPELERCVKELGFVGCNLNPDPSGGYWKEPPLTDRWWYPFYEKMVELEVPAMVHVTGTCNPAFHTTGSHYINGDTTAFMQFLTSDLFKDFPTLKFIIPHGGGAVPYHWGRYRGMAQDMKRPPLKELLLNNVYFDTCVYHQPGIDCLAKVIPADNILFASEMVGAVKGIDPGDRPLFRRHPALHRRLDQLAGRGQTEQYFRGQRACKVYPRLRKANCGSRRGATLRLFDPGRGIMR